MNKINNKLVMVTVLASIFGMLSGIVGAIIARVYILEEAFNLPLVGNISLSDGANGTGLIIRDAKKIVVEQNDKVDETIKNVKSGIIGIFKKIDANKITANKINSESEFNLDNFYKLNEEAGQGFIITSDGWIVSDYIPETFKNGLATNTKEAILKNYVVILSDNKIYSVNNIISDPLNKYAFWRISANDLPVKRFVNADEVKNGQMIVATNWDGDVLLSSIVAEKENDSGIVKSSDNFSTKIKIANLIESGFNGGFIFNLNSEIVALINSEGEAELVSSLIPCMNCLFKMNEIVYPKLGINYIELSGFLESQKGVYSKGALIYANKNSVAIIKGGAAALAGLKAGDIITKINNIEINLENSLSSQINKYLSGEEIVIEYIRDNKSNTVKVILK